eukprot:g21689.t1
MMNDIEAGPESWKGTGQFWQVMTQKHQQMDRLLETAWTLAMWFVLPYLANNVIVGLIGLVACLSAVVTSQNAFVAFTGFFLICANVFSFAQRLSEMAGVTKMCMSTRADTRSILSYAIGKSGPSPCTEAGLQRAGYSSIAKERSDHARFLTYLMANRAGVEMFGVLIDTQLIARFVFQATTGFLALLSYMLANLDIRTEDLLAPETSRTTGVPPEGSLKQQICQGRFEAWVSQMKLGHNPLVYELYKRLELLSHSVTNSSVRCLLVEFSIAGMHGVYKQSSCFDPTSPTWLLNSESNKMEQIPNLVVDWTLDDELLISSRYYTGAERRGPYVDESRLSERFGSDTIRALGGLNRLLQFLGLICADPWANMRWFNTCPI